MPSSAIETSSTETASRPSLLWRWAGRGFSAADVLNALQPRRGWKVETDIAYMPGARGMLDVYTPSVRTDAPAPIVIFFYGGSWQSGSRDIYKFVGASLAAKGIVTVVPDYRIYPQAKYPDFLDDAAKAVRFVRDHAARWHGDARQIILMGHSAGAYIAASLAFDKGWLGDVDFAGLIGLAGPYDFLPIVDPVLQEIFGGAERIETQPIQYVAPGAPPALLIAARHDNIVSPGNTTRLAARLRNNGGTVIELSYRRIGHLSIIGTFAPLLRGLAPVFRDVVNFVRNPKGVAQP